MQKGDFMPGIKFNHLTKEIELKGPESFIESNFNKIQDLLIESFGMRKKMIATEKRTTNDDTISKVTAPATASISPVFSNERKVTRPPLRKYIRKVGMPGQERTVVEVVEQKPKEISLESLKEKFGLSKSKNGRIVRDTDKQEKARKGLNGSYAWT